MPRSGGGDNPLGVADYFRLAAARGLGKLGALAYESANARLFEGTYLSATGQTCPVGG